jgi:general secretion pathway protein J
MNNLFKILSTRSTASRLRQPAPGIPAEAGSPLRSDRHPASSSQYPVSSIKHPASGSQNPAAGFTLMEILLAFLILGIVITAILGSFNAVFSTTDTLENSGQYYEMAKNSLNRMTRDLDALFIIQPPLYKKRGFDDPPDPYRIVGGSLDIGGTGFATLRFASSAHIPLDGVGRAGIAEIVYYVHAKNDGQLVLKRADHLYPYPPFEERSGDAVLCQDVKSLAFKYYNADGEVSEEWDSDSDQNGYATPTAVGIQLEIGKEAKSYTFETTVRLAVSRTKIE